MPSDPIRGLVLLWGRRERPTRGPKPGLDLDRIVRAGIEVADAEGLDALSMRKVAERLGVGTMSLYRYVPSKQELLDLMFDAMMGERGPQPEDDDWRVQLEHFARDGLAIYKRHPWMLDVPTRRPPLGPNVLGSFDAMLQVLRTTGISSAQMVAAATALGVYVAGAARAVVESAESERRTGVSDEAWWDERSSFWDDFFDPERFPALVHVWETGGYAEPLDDFEFGLGLVLDGIAALIARAGGPPGS
jgi:AcrR family transcriptional regulator